MYIKIYDYIKDLAQEKENLEVLKLIPMDREETIDSFETFKNKVKNKTMY